MPARALIASLAAGGMCTVIAVAGASGAGPSPVGSRVPISGGSNAQRLLARRAALRVGGITLTRIAFRPPSRLLRRQQVHGTELVVSSGGKETLRADWEQQLYVGVYLGLMERWPRAAVAAAATDQSEAPAARLHAYDVFGSNPKSRQVARLTERVIDVASRAHAHVDELRVSATPARAVALTMTVRDPAAFLKHRARAVLAVFSRSRVPLLGYYVGLNDAHGRLVWATYQLPASGGVFVVPRLDSCSPVAHSEAFGDRPPPCPAP